MAFETLGLNLVVKGAAQFARDINWVNTSMLRYAGTMRNYENQLLAVARTEQRVASQRIQAAYKFYGNMREVMYEFQTMMQSMAASGIQATSGFLQDYTDAMNLYLRGQDELEAAINDGIETNNRYNQIASKSIGVFDLLKSALETLTGGFGKNVIQTTAFGGLISKLAPQVAALSFVLDAVKLGVDMFTYGVKLVVGTLQLLWNIVKKVVGVVIDLAAALGRYLWDALKKVASAIWQIATSPFRLVVNMFNGLFDAIKNIIQIAIGMNFERILWGIGQKLREITQEALEAGSAFQLVQIRLRGLLQREMAETSGVPFSESLETATTRAKDLSYWISELGVKSIFSTTAISDIMTLAMSYDYTESQAKDLTLAAVNFATAMGLDNLAMVRIVENMGQMRAAGKMTGTELRDLARGSFVPVNRVFQIMAKSADVASLSINQYAVKTEFAGKTEKELNALLEEGVEVYELVGKKARTWQELKAAGAKGEIPVDLFIKSFIEMTKQDFPDAVDKASSSMQVITSNIKDFIESFIGWRVFTPLLDIIAERMQKLMGVLISTETRTKFEEIGKAIATIFKTVAEFLDSKGPNIETMVKNILDHIVLLSKVAAAVIRGDFISALSLTFGPDYWNPLPPTRTWTPAKVEAGWLQDMKRVVDKYNPYAFITDPGTYEETQEKIQNISQSFRDSLFNVIKFIEEHQDDISKFLNDPIGWIKTDGIPILKGLATEGFEFLKGKAQEALDYISGWFKENAPYIIQTVGEGIQGALQGIAGFIATHFGKDNLLYQFVDLVKELIGYFTVKFGPGSEPIFNEFGLYAGMTDYQGNLQTATNDLSKAFETLKTSIKNMITEGLNALGEWLTNNIFNWNNFVELWKKIEASVPIVEPGIVHIAEALGTKVEDTGSVMDTFKILSDVLTDLGKIGIDIIAASLRILFDVISGFIMFLKLWGAGFSIFVNAFDTFVKAWNSFWHGGGMTNMGVSKEQMDAAIKNALSGVPKEFDSTDSTSSLGKALDNTKDWKNSTEDEFMNLWDSLTRRSIVPDMMEDIKDSILMTLDTIIMGLPGRIAMIVEQFQIALNKVLEFTNAVAAAAGLPQTGGGGSGGGGGGSSKWIPQASGGDWIVNSPTLFLAGEAGAEHARFEPVSNTTKNYNLNVSTGLTTNNIVGQYQLIKALVD